MNRSIVGLLAAGALLGTGPCEGPVPSGLTNGHVVGTWGGENAGLIGDEIERPHRADRNVDRHFRPARAFRHPSAIRAGHGEIGAVHVDRMVGHGQVADPHAHTVALAHDQMVDGGKDA